MKHVQWPDGQGGELAHGGNSPFDDPGWKSLDVFMRVGAYYRERSGFGLTHEVLTAPPSPAKLLFLFKAHWEIPAVFSGLL